ncbi:MAG TPA: GspH/FimT family pseudopilin [Candidatus Methylomirabilis sp.]|nr:GspH/FimT family pseudopilin [Candidatus Methylomirabilis sp.]HSC70618.1 GspH/FimT family pseudopilin [Candidatus Methylomirabilis sp.]
MPTSLAGRCSRRPAARGFTLIELVVVVAIVSVVFALTLPALGDGLRRWRLQAAVREVATFLKFTRNQSVTGRSPLQAFLDRSRNVYWVDKPDNPMLYTPDLAIQRGVRVFALPTGIRFGEVTAADPDPAADRVGILFFPKGSSTGAAVQILDDRGRAYRISVDPVTGRARIER